MGKGNTPDKKPVALIAGPTASGKSDLAVLLALALEKRGKRGVVINADSAQVYADLRILSARPTEDDMRGVEHRLFGAWDGAHACSAAEWAAAAKVEIAALHAEGAIPILCGGTGMYLQVLIDGIAEIPAIDPVIRDQVRKMPTASAYAALQFEDPERAAQLNPADSQRISRSLEVVRSTGVTIGEWQREKEGGIGEYITLHPLVLLPDREWLYERCDRRFEIMLDHGAIEEVELLLARGLSDSLPVMRAIGVPEIAAMIKDELSRGETIAAGQQATRNYAKRQYTWFRLQPPENWLQMTSQEYNIEVIFASLFQH